MGCMQLFLDAHWNVDNFLPNFAMNCSVSNLMMNRTVESQACGTIHVKRCASEKVPKHEKV
jgi:hypothetical protein